jgi:hypothetical protein
MSRIPRALGRLWTRIGLVQRLVAAAVLAVGGSVAATAARLSELRRVVQHIAAGEVALRQELDTFVASLRAA